MLTLSIITINYNNARGLEKTIISVINQSFKDFEFIVIDGGSNDESLEIIKKYANDITYWISEKDKGIYNAMNKGILKAKGKYCQFLNSGDWLVDNNVLEKVFSKHFDEDILYGNRIEIFPDKEIINKGYQTSELTFRDAYKGCILHTCSFSKRVLFDRFDLFDENFKM